MIKTIEGNKNRIITVTFILLFGMFCFFSLADLHKRMSDYRFFATKINAIIQKTYVSETSYLNLRMINYVTAIIDERGVTNLIKNRDRSGLKKIFDPVYWDFAKRFVPVISLVIVDSEQRILYQKLDTALKVHATGLNSTTLEAAIKDRKPAYGFETDAFPLHYSISVPVLDKTTNRVAGAIEVGINPAWFHFKLRWFLDNIKTAIVVKNKSLDQETAYSSLPDEYAFIVNQDLRKNDIRFFESILRRIIMSKDILDLKVGDRYYIISTSPLLLTHHKEEAGRLLVAYDMTEFRNRQWGYIYVWLIFFASTACLMLLVSFIGFRKYERIITDQGKKLAHRSKQCALGEMLSYIGHQWRQPLNTLSLTVQNIELQNRLGKLDGPMLEKQVALANRNIEYLTQVIEDWRSLLISGTTRQVIDLADSVSRAIGIVAPALESCRIHVDNRITGSTKTLGFVNDLVQLTVNILLNAKDALATREGARIIQLSASEENDIVTVTFQDSGGGIPERLLEKVFEAYLTTKDDLAGTGLGLYLCRQIAENLDSGKVWAENREFEVDGTRLFGACISLQFKKLSEGVPV
ncbi:sensor histidine kinase [Geobacter sulfurreducens]|uniref:sensor histidine kinase n=1 Tax=Geobacter sulfurreducens TaxID=35554 RepID=UPI000E64E9D3|nr:HAMP domain-containing sensor histidine kinase [Geobacter sulfurreducens]